MGSVRSLPVAEFVDAYALFFGGSGLPEDALRRVRGLELRALKQVYRKRAQETHPDRAHLRSLDAPTAHEEFQGVVAAYELLKLVRDGTLAVDMPRAVTPTPDLSTQRKPQNPGPGAPGGEPAVGTPRGREQRSQRSTGAAERERTDTPGPAAESTQSRSAGREKRSRYCPESNHYFDRELPRRQLAFGQYLYYSGVITWKQLIDALVWQRQQCPPVGQLARQWGILTDWQVESVLESRQLAGRYDIRFADYAQEMGYLTHRQAMALMGRVNLVKKPIGQYFLQAGILDMAGLARQLSDHRCHNWQAIQRTARAR